MILKFKLIIIDRERGAPLLRRQSMTSSLSSSDLTSDTLHEAGDGSDEEAVLYHHSESFKPLQSKRMSQYMKYYSPSNYHLSPFRSSRSLATVKSDKEAIYASASEKRFVPPLLLIGSILGILFCTAGMASAMLVWIYTHKLPLKSNGVIYLHEGNEDELAREYTDKTIGDAAAKLRFDQLSSHPTTLSLSSIIVFFIGGSLYPMMGLIAYGLAADWIQLQERVATSYNVDLTDQLPTPLQYALLTRICSTNSISSIFDTIQHWNRTRKTSLGASIPVMLKKALLWLILLLFLQTSIAWLDFVLHETTRAVSVIQVDEQIIYKSYSMGINTTLCPSDTSSTLPCLVSPPSSPNQVPLFAAEDSIIGSEGWLTANGVSSLYSVQSYRDAQKGSTHDGMAFYSHPNIRRQDYLESFNSIGLAADCHILTTRCDPLDDSFDCSKEGRSELATNNSSGISDRLYTIGTDGIAQLGQDAYNGAPSNPWNISGLAVFPFASNFIGSGFHNFTVQTSSNDSTLISSPHSFAAFTCRMTLQDLDLSYFNETYQLLSSAVSDKNIAHSLSGPMVAGLVKNVAFSPLASVAGRVDEEAFARSVKASLSYNILALSAGLVGQEPVLVRSWRPILAQQYDKMTLFIYIGLLYAYALASIFLFFWAWATSSSCIVYQDEKGIYREVPAVVLAQRRLTEPVGYLIASHLESNQNVEVDHTCRNLAASSRTARIKLPHIFDNRQTHQDRLVVGLESTGAGFGVWNMSRARGAISSSDRNKDSILRANHSNAFTNNIHHKHEAYL